MSRGHEQTFRRTPETSVIRTRQCSTGSLLSSKPCGCHPRQEELDFRSLAGLTIEIEPSTQTIRDDAVDNMQAEARAALIAPCREERIERFTPDTATHAATIVGKKNLDNVVSRGLHLDVDGTSLVVGKRVLDRVEKEIC